MRTFTPLKTHLLTVAVPELRKKKNKNKRILIKENKREKTTKRNKKKGREKGITKGKD